MSVKEPDVVKLLSDIYESKIYVSLDIKQDNIMVKGWNEKSNLKIQDVLELYNETKIKGYIVTDIQNDGMMNGLNISFVNNTITSIEETNKMNKKIIIAGGLTNYEDLKNLKKLNLKNVEGIISGKSYYVGNINLTKAQEILNSNA